MTGVLSISLLSCSPKTKLSNLPFQNLEAFSYSGEQEVSDRWWRSFEDQKLNILIDSALQSNFNLETAWLRLSEAQAVVDRESSIFFPDLEASVRGEINRPQLAFQEFEQNRSVSIGLSSVYEIDLWGRIRSRVQARRYESDATLADYRAATISVSAEITRTWYQLVEAHNQLDLVEDQIDTNEKVLNLIKARFGIGQIRSVDILRQKQLVKSTQEQKILEESRIKVLENRLAVLTGRPPQNDIYYTYDNLPDLPPLPETGIPIQLVRRRPDIQSAYHLLQAADQEVAAAISNRYPRLSLSLSLSTAYNEADNLFKNWAHSLVGNLVAPVFYGGQLQAEVDRTEAVKMQRLYEYGQATLTAFREVEDALIQEIKQAERIQVIEEQVDLASTAYEQLQIEYLNGMTDYLDVLTALDEVQQLRRDLLSARLSLVEYRIALCRALAGPIETERELRVER